MQLDDTIVALGSPSGPALRGVVRMSGPDVRRVLEGWFQPDDLATWNESRAARRHPGWLHLPQSRCPFEVAVHLWPGRRSYTGEPVAELHLTGSVPVLDLVLQTSLTHGARAARPGEFTLRAFLAGKLDLLQAEAVLGVIDAVDHEELTTALGQLAGGISHRMVTFRGDLLELLADLEAGLDFVEEHLEFVSREDVARRIESAHEFIAGLQHQAQGRMHAGDRWRVVLAGLPNAGKSTLFNALTGASALVSPIPGTTRDYLSAELDWKGLRFDLVDTAGSDRAETTLEADMQSFRREQIRRADLVVWCTAADATSDDMRIDDVEWSDARREARQILRIVTKADLTSSRSGTMPHVAVSAHSRTGLDDLAALIARTLTQDSIAARQWLGTSAARCATSLSAAAEALRRAMIAAREPRIGDELIAIELRDSLDHLGQIVGAVYTDDLLDRIFSKFCIGK